MVILDCNPAPAADAVVAADGSGNYTTITAAVAAVALKSTKRYVIYIKKGTYNEVITIGKNTWNLTLIGDGMEATIITGHQSVRGGVSSTSKTDTVTVDGIGFVARELTIENTAGAENDQAVALLSNSDASALYRCGIRAYQDTLYAKSNRQFYRECKISGTVDFIFGDATAVFQHCDIVARLPLRGQQNTITAQSRATATSTTGFSFQDCNIYADDDLRRAPAGSVETYLGRPWQPIQNTQPFSRVVFMECNISDVIDPKGWLPWEGRTDVSDIYYGEYKNTGNGADVSGRVKWTSFHVIQDASEAAKYTVEKFIQGDKWIPPTGVYFKPSSQ